MCPVSRSIFVSVSEFSVYAVLVSWLSSAVGIASPPQLPAFALWFLAFFCPFLLILLAFLGNMFPLLDSKVHYRSLGKAFHCRFFFT